MTSRKKNFDGQDGLDKQKTNPVEHQSESLGSSVDPDDSIAPELVEEALQTAVEELGGSRRDGQVQMCLQVANSFDNGTHLMVQAGTGTGKSLGYLIPALLRASLRDERVVISTATLALQNQLITKDIPLAVRAVAKVTGKEPVRASVLKGWSNYLCRRKLSGSYPDDDTLFAGSGLDASTSLEKEVVRIRNWAEDSPRGDRDELKPGVSDRAWSQFSVSSDLCLGRTCPMRENCFPTRARTRAGSAKVIVTNHSMVGVHAAGLSEVLGSYDLLVIDEAHELPERVRSQASMQLTEVTLERLRRRLQKAKDLFEESNDLDEFNSVCDKFDDDIDQFVAVLSEAGEGRLRAGLPPDFLSAINNLDRELRVLLRLVKDCAEGGDSEDDEARITLLLNALDSAHTTAQMLIGADGVTQVLWVTQPVTKREKPKLHCAPLEVAEDIGANLFSGCSAVVTSATLRVGTSFEVMASRLGLEGLPEIDWSGIDVGSPFDYQKQGILYIPNDLEIPGRGGISESYLERIVSLAKASEGGLLGLFTSRRAVNLAAEYLRENLDYPILVQGEEQLPNLIADFRSDPHSCLIGTASLWQGVDVPGLNCRLVTIDRIPFSRPDDPVAQARCDAAERENRSGFFDVSVPDASLKLAQGVGRLLRTDADKGVVAILDSRIVTKGYGRVLLSSLPRMWFTNSQEQVEKSLSNLATLAVKQAQAANKKPAKPKTKPVRTATTKTAKKPAKSTGVDRKKVAKASSKQKPKGNA